MPLRTKALLCVPLALGLAAAAAAQTYDRILQADRSIKRGETDETTALELLTAELAAAG